MGRRKHEECLNEVERLEDGKKWRCKRCKNVYSGSVTRIEAHIKGTRGKGISTCKYGNVPNGEFDQLGPHNNVAGPSNPRQVAGFDPSSSNHPNHTQSYHFSEVARDAHEMIGPSNTQSNHLYEVVAGAHETSDAHIIARNHPNCSQSNNDGSVPFEEVYESYIRSKIDDLRLEESNVKRDVDWLKRQGKRSKKEVDEWLEEAHNLIEKAEQWMGQTNNAVSEAALTKQLEGHIKMKPPLVLWNELVGWGFETNLKEVMRLLRDDNVYAIGICGMGGVGKTCLVTESKDQLIRNNTTYNFKKVFWVTVSQKFSVLKLQDDIAKRMGITLDKDDEVKRAEMLYRAWEKFEKWVLILDDVWNYIDFRKVGIPVGRDGTKLILTSRLKHLCLRMGCSPDNIIVMKPLWMSEGWALFLLKLGYNGAPATLPSEVEKIAKSVCDKCDGLPLGISVMAKSMRGIEDISSWRSALNKLRNSTVGIRLEGEMEEEVLKVLKMSYDNLEDTRMQKCFLNCALWLSNSSQAHKQPIMWLVECGLINEMQTLGEILDEGLAILIKLQRHSLLLEHTYWGCRMHDLLRDMACQIMGPTYMVKRGRSDRRRMPDIREWTADLEGVSLAGNWIKEMAAGTSPQCPKLSTLILSHNSFTCIPDCFFSHMNALTLLNLSHNFNLTHLPNTLSDLRSLVCLMLRGCKSLKYVPPLEKLKKLSRLDISSTKMEKVPQGLKMLINLKWLDLSQNKYLEWESPFLLNLTNMQYLNLWPHEEAKRKMEVRAEDVRGMDKLEYFVGNCININDCEFLGRLNSYYLRISSIESFCGEDMFYHDNELSMLGGTQTITITGDYEELVHFLPTGLTKLNVVRNNLWKGCLCDSLQFKDSSSLRVIIIQSCPQLKNLFCLSASCSFCTRLQCLEDIHVVDCDSMVEIIAAEDTQTIILPKLKLLYLQDMPKLKSVCKGIIASQSPPDISTRRCLVLKNDENVVRYKSYDYWSNQITPLNVHYHTESESECESEEEEEKEEEDVEQVGELEDKVAKVE